METTWNRSVAAPGGVGARAAALPFGVASRLAAATRHAWGRWQATRQRAAEQRTLAGLSPAVLRDIGADCEAIHHAQQREQRISGREALLRLM